MIVYVRPKRPEELSHSGVKGMKRYQHKFGRWQRQAKYANGQPDPDADSSEKTQEVQKIVDLMKTIKYSEFTHLMTAEQVRTSKKGSCHDQVMLELDELKAAGFNPKAKYIMAVDDNGQGSETHSFAFFKNGDNVYWIENAWDDQKGLHSYPSEEKLVEDVTNKFKSRNSGKIYLADFNPEEHKIGEDLAMFVDKCMDSAEEVGDDHSQESQKRRDEAVKSRGKTKANGSWPLDRQRALRDVRTELYKNKPKALNELDRAINKNEWSSDFLEAIQNSKISTDGDAQAMAIEYAYYLSDPEEYLKKVKSELSHSGVKGTEWYVRRFQPYTQVPTRSGKIGKFIGSYTDSSLDHRVKELEEQAIKSWNRYKELRAKYGKNDERVKNAKEDAYRDGAFYGAMNKRLNVDREQKTEIGRMVLASINQNEAVTS